MFVIDRVELNFVNQVREVRNLDRPHPSFRQHLRCSGDEVVEVRNMRQYVVGNKKVRRTSCRPDSPGSLNSKEGHICRYSVGNGDTRPDLSWFNPQTWNTEQDEISKQVSVVTRDLDHSMRVGEFESLHNHVGVPLGVIEPR